MAQLPLRLGVAVSWAVAAALAAVAPSVARADAPQQQGWWTVTNPGGLPANPATTATDVPSDGLLVQSGPVNPTSPCNCTAYAGLVYELSDGFTASDLTLKVAPQSATTPVATLELCALVNPALQAEQGGPLSDAPDYNCSKHETASLGAGGDKFTFHVGSLVSNGVLAVAILPADSTSRAVLSKPDSASLATIAAPPSTAATFPGPASTGATTNSGATSSGDNSTAAAAQPPPELPQQPTVDNAGPGQTPVVAPSRPASPLTAAPVAATSGTGNGSKPIAIVILVAAVGVGAALWTMAGRAPAIGNE